MVRLVRRYDHFTAVCWRHAAFLSCTRSSCPAWSFEQNSGYEATLAVSQTSAYNTFRRRMISSFSISKNSNTANGLKKKGKNNGQSIHFWQVICDSCNFVTHSYSLGQCHSYAHRSYPWTAGRTAFYLPGKQNPGRCSRSNRVICNFNRYFPDEVVTMRIHGWFEWLQTRLLWDGFCSRRGCRLFSHQYNSKSMRAMILNRVVTFW